MAGGLFLIRQDGHLEVRRRLARGGGGSVYGIDDGDGDNVAKKGGWLRKSSCNTCRPKSQPRPGQMSKLQNV